MLTTGILFAILAAAAGDEHPHATAEKLGTVRFETSCSAAAQPRFTRAVALLHSFEFPEAIAGFDAALQADPECAIAWWGIALSRWGNPFGVFIRPETQLLQGQDAVARATATGAKSARERAYVQAVSLLYADAARVDQKARMLAYRDAMADLTAQYPADTEAAIFYALALVATEEPTDKTYASRLQAAAILEKLLPAQPDHPGLAHYLIHTYDVPSLAPRALDAAHRYAKIAPSAPHALHMPSHTFTRVGAWQESIDANVASAAAADRQGAITEELHALDYQMYAYLQSGQDAAARRLLDSLPAIVARLDPDSAGSAAPVSAGVYATAAIPARFALERRAWAEAARLEPRPGKFPYAEAVTWYARALGAAHTGDTGAVRPALEALAQIRDRLAAAGESYWAEQVEIERRASTAALAFAERRNAEALAEMRAAAEREDATEKAAVTPGPIAPVRELLAEMLLELGQPAEALKEFEATLGKEPNRFHAVAGAAQAARQAGNAGVARQYEQLLARICERGDRPGRCPGPS